MLNGKAERGAKVIGWIRGTEHVHGQSCPPDVFVFIILIQIVNNNHSIDLSI